MSTRTRRRRRLLSNVFRSAADVAVRSSRIHTASDVSTLSRAVEEPVILRIRLTEYVKVSSPPVCVRHVLDREVMAGSHGSVEETDSAGGNRRGAALRAS